MLEQTTKKLITARRDFHLNGNALYVLGCGGFEARRRNAMALWTDPSRLLIIHCESLSYGCHTTWRSTSAARGGATARPGASAHASTAA